MYPRKEKEEDKPSDDKKKENDTIQMPQQNEQEKTLDKNTKKEGHKGQRGEQNLPKGDNGRRGDQNQAKQVWLTTGNRFDILDKGKEGKITQNKGEEGKISTKKCVEENFNKNSKWDKFENAKEGNNVEIVSSGKGRDESEREDIQRDTGIIFQSINKEIHEKVHEKGEEVDADKNSKIGQSSNNDLEE